MGQKSKLPMSLKADAVKSYLSGKESPSKIMQKYGISRTTLERWAMVYQFNGPEGLAMKSRYQSYSRELKLQVINDYLTGNISLVGVCKRYHISSDSIVRKWLKKYNGHEDIKSSNAGGKTYMTNGRITTFEERIEIVQFCVENNNDYLKTVEKYQISYPQIYTWIQKYKKNGIDGLVDRRGKRKEVTSMTELERLRAEQKLLQAENKRLQMENAFLKKLDEVERGRGKTEYTRKTDI